MIELSGNALAKLQRLMAANREVARDLERVSGPFKANTLRITGAVAERWQRDAPRLTGALALATRESFGGGVGRVFIDPGATNPVSGGKPAVYGAVVHRRQPWVERIVSGPADGIVRESLRKLDGDLDNIYGN